MPRGVAVEALRISAADLAFVYLVAKAYDGMGGLVGRLLASWPVVGLGRVSYGVYVYHFMVPHLVTAVVSFCGYPPPTWSLWLIALYLPITALLVAASWFVVERPLLRLKSRFNYSRDERPTPGTPLPTLACIPMSHLSAQRSAA
jgi:peptidoglycan/LPS O-acetylase OafA/YrhL